MRTLALFITLGCIAAGTAGAGEPVDELGPPGEADAAAIDRGIDLLGAPRYATREAAQRWLWEVGDPAMPALREAVRSDDAEVVMRASDLLEMIEMGVPPDADPELLNQARRLRNGEKPEQVVAVAKLSGMGAEGRAVLRKLAPRIEDEQVRQRALEALYREAAADARRRIAAGDVGGAYDLLERAAMAGAEPVFADFAAMARQLDRLDAAIERAGASETPNRHRLLAALHRAAGRPDEAAQVLRDADDHRTLEALLIEAGDWRPLHAHDRAQHEGVAARAPTHQSRRRLATLERLATGSDQAVLDLAEQWGDDDRARLVELLMLNGRPDRAVAAYADQPLLRRFSIVMAFGSLADQKPVVRAIVARDGWARPPARVDAQAEAVPTSTAIEAAAWLIHVGRRDEAARLKRRLSDEPTADNQKLAAGLMRLGFDEAVKPKLATLIDWESDDPLTGELARAMFGSRRAGERARVWANVLGERNLDPADRLRTLRALMGGEAEAARLDRALGWFEAWWGARRPRRADHAMRVAETLLAHDRDGAAWLMDQREGADAEWSVSPSLGRWLARHGQWAKAATVLVAQVEARPTHVSARWLLGHAEQRRGHAESGERHRRIAELLPMGSAGHRSDLLDAMSLAEGTGEAIDRHRRLMLAVGQPGEYATEVANMTAGERALAEGRHAEALRRVERTRLWLLRDSVGAMWGGLAEIDRSARRARAMLELRAGRVDQALAQGRALADHYPHSIDGIIQLVHAFDDADASEAGDALFDHAFAKLRAVCKRFPDSAALHNEAAWLAARCRRGLDAALTLAERAVAIEPDLDPALDTLAEVHFQRGDRARAIQWIDKAIQINPDLAYYRKQKERFKTGDTSSAPPE